MNILSAEELEGLVRRTFPSRDHFSAGSQSEFDVRRGPPVAMVHGGPDPFLDRQFDAWIAGKADYVSLYELLNRLCRAGALAPGDYAVMGPHPRGDGVPSYTRR
jgi:hypothetical protein